MKRTVAFVSILLFSALAGSLLVNPAKANFIGLAAPHIKSSKLLVEEPLNNSICKTNDIFVRFSLELSVWIPSPEDQKRYLGGVYPPDVKSSIKCFLDGRLVWQKSELDLLDYPFQFEFSLSKLSKGLHNLTFKSTTKGDFFLCFLESNGWHHTRPETPLYLSSSVSFSVEPPNVKILSVEPEQVFDVVDIPLKVYVSEPFRWLSYSLDGSDNVTVSGNSTLTGLSEGRHTLTVCAANWGGLVGSSRTRYFNVILPSQHILYSSISFPISLVGIAIITSTALVSFGLVAYFVRRNRRRSK